MEEFRSRLKPSQTAIIVGGIIRINDRYLHVQVLVLGGLDSLEHRLIAPLQLIKLYH